MAIQEVLHEVQKNLKAPKGQYNSFGNYKYRSCEDILEGVKKVLPEGYGVTLTDEITEVGGRVYVKAVATLFGEDKEISVSAFAREPASKKGMDESQITGATSSYARKYALNGLFCIDDTKDADTDEHRKQEDKAPAKPSFTQEQLDAKQQFIINIQNCKTKEELDAMNPWEIIESLPEEMQSEVNDQLDVRYRQIENGVELMPAKWGFNGVNDANKWLLTIKPVVENFKNPEMLVEWQKNNQAKINGLDILSAQKYKDDKGRSPKDRLVDALASKLNEISQAPQAAE